MPYSPSPARYEGMQYRRAGRSGLKLPAISLGLWHNFGHDTQPDRSRKILHEAFDLGITHFDLANNYGPRPALQRNSSARSFPRISRPIATR